LTGRMTPLWMHFLVGAAHAPRGSVPALVVYPCGRMVAHRPPGFRGRTSECEALDRLLEDVRGGQSAILVIRGEAGVGKTALLRYPAGQAAGFRVAHISGVEAEMELAVAALRALCR